jgi:RNA polymerase sigma-70 factor (ECF subfamily)
LAFIDGVPGLVWAPGGKPRVVFKLTTVDEKIAAIDLIADPAEIARFDLRIAET